MVSKDAQKRILIQFVLSIVILSYLGYLFYFIFFIWRNYVPTRLIDNISILLFIFSSTMVFIGTNLLYNISNNKERYFVINFKTIPRNYFKIILLILIIFIITIPPISNISTVVDWDQVSFPTLIRGTCLILLCSFLPGANIYNLFLSNLDLKNLFKFNTFLLKLTIYPLLSFGFIGCVVLILDQIGLTENSITSILFFIIFGLLILDILVYYFRTPLTYIRSNELKFSKGSLFILLIGIAIAILALTVHFSVGYLIPGDSWTGVRSAVFIGIKNESPIELGYKVDYPLFWGYTIYGLSKISGLPFINTNAILAPFCYLFVFSIYFFIKSLLSNQKGNYPVLATFLVTIFSSLFIGTLYDNSLLGGISEFIFYNEFYFFYKTYAYCLLFFSLALFVKVLNKKNDKHIQFSKIKSNKDLKLIILSVIFLLFSFLTYVITLLGGFILSFILVVFLKNKVRNFQLLVFFIISFVIFLLFFDIIMNFLLSHILFIQIDKFFNVSSIFRIFGNFNSIIGIYIILLILIIFTLILKKYLSKMVMNDSFKRYVTKLDSKNFAMIVLYTSFFFLILAISFIIIDENFTRSRLKDTFFFAFYIDKIYTNIGFIGIIGILVSPLCYKKDKRLFYFLISFIIIIFLVASILIFKFFFIDFPNISPNDLPYEAVELMNYWFRLTWSFSIPPLAILCAIGLYDLPKYIRRFFNNKRRKGIFRFLGFNLKIISIISFIILSFSNIFIVGVFWDSSKLRIEDNQAQVIGWISENIPRESKILIEKNRDPNYHFKRAIGSIGMCHVHYFEEIFPNYIYSINFSDYENEVNNLREKEIKYLIFSINNESWYPIISEFIWIVLIPNFYNVSLFEYKNLAIFYASIN
ncbi:MAG: hypothetical protein ACFFHD_00475 [Promethearchaeota archaeon]